jgi:hypothetical protein
MPRRPVSFLTPPLNRLATARAPGGWTDATVGPAGGCHPPRAGSSPGAGGWWSSCRRRWGRGSRRRCATNCGDAIGSVVGIPGGTPRQAIAERVVGVGVSAIAEEPIQLVVAIGGAGRRPKQIHNAEVETERYWQIGRRRNVGAEPHRCRHLEDRCRIGDGELPVRWLRPTARSATPSSTASTG